jgi:hypothetical protein
MRKAFKLDVWVFHFCCGFSTYHVSFNLPFKTQENILSVTQDFRALANDNWGFTTRYVQSDRESGLGQKWQDFVATKGITFNSDHQRLQVRTVGLNVLGGDHADSAQDLHTEQVASRDLALHRLARYPSFESHPSAAKRVATTIANGV